MKIKEKADEKGVTEAAARAAEKAKIAAAQAATYTKESANKIKESH